MDGGGGCTAGLGAPNKPNGSSSNPLPLKFNGDTAGPGGLEGEGPGVRGREAMGTGVYAGSGAGICGLGGMGVGAFWGLVPAQSSNGSLDADLIAGGGAPGLASFGDFSPGLSFMHSGQAGWSIESISRQGAQKKRRHRWQVPTALRSM